MAGVSFSARMTFGRAVAVEDAVRGERGGGAFGFDFGESFAESERFGLRKDIGHH